MNGRPSSGSGSSTQTTTAVKWPLCIVFNVFITSTPRHCSRTHLNGSHFAHTRHATVYVHFRTAACYTHTRNFLRSYVRVCVCDMKKIWTETIGRNKANYERQNRYWIVLLQSEWSCVPCPQHALNSVPTHSRELHKWFRIDRKAVCRSCGAILWFIPFLYTKFTICYARWAFRRTHLVSMRRNRLNNVITNSNDSRRGREAEREPPKYLVVLWAQRYASRAMLRVCACVCSAWQRNHIHICTKLITPVKLAKKFNALGSLFGNVKF